MPSRRVLLPLVLLLALTAVVAGCGGDDEVASYEQGLAGVQSQLESGNEPSQDAAQATEPAERSAALERAQAAIEQAADEADELDPPSDAKEGHEQLVAALRDYADLYARLAALGTTAADQSAQAGLYAEAGGIVERIEQANAKIADAGVEVGGNDADE